MKMIHTLHKKYAAPAKRILCVDADDESRHLAAEMLYEYEVDFALTVEDAQQLAWFNSYVVCLVDPAVSENGGCALIDALWAIDRCIPVIVYSEHDVLLNEPLCGQWADAWLTKPLREHELREAISRVTMLDGMRRRVVRSPISRSSRPHRRAAAALHA